MMMTLALTTLMMSPLHLQPSSISPRQGLHQLRLHHRPSCLLTFSLQGQGLLYHPAMVVPTHIQQQLLLRRLSSLPMSEALAMAALATCMATHRATDSEIVSETLSLSLRVQAEPRQIRDPAERLMFHPAIHQERGHLPQGLAMAAT